MDGVGGDEAEALGLAIVPNLWEPPPVEKVLAVH